MPLKAYKTQVYPLAKGFLGWTGAKGLRGDWHGRSVFRVAGVYNYIFEQMKVVLENLEAMNFKAAHSKLGKTVRCYEAAAGQGELSRKE